MEVINDEWSGLFASLIEKINEDGRRELLATAINDVRTMTIASFGEFGDGMMRPWHDELLLSKSYIRTLKKASGRTVATLERTEEEREACEGTKWEGGQGQHLIDSFVIESDANSATLSNISEYASQHQLGEGVPRRPFFPVDEAGNLMPAMEARLVGILDAHFSL